MTRVISVINQKGGVGKTTTCLNVAAYLASMGRSVLVVDLDPQGNATSGFGIDYKRLERGLYESLVGDAPVAEHIHETEVDKLHLVPSTPNLAGANIDLVHMDSREFSLSETLAPILEEYDYIFIDNPPSLGLLTVNGLVAARELIIPVQCEYYSLEGLGQLLETIDLVKSNLKGDLDILGAVMTMYDDRNKLARAVFDELYRYFPDKIFRTVIPRNTKLAEAPSYGKPIMLYDRWSRGARAYKRLAKEIISTE